MAVTFEMSQGSHFTANVLQVRAVRHIKRNEVHEKFDVIGNTVEPKIGQCEVRKFFQLEDWLKNFSTLFISLT